MFAAAIAYLESKTPTWVKVIIALVIVGWMLPLKVQEFAYDFVDTRVHATLMPITVSRDHEVKELHSRIDNLQEKTNETNAFVRAIALKELGTKRYQEVELTRVDNK